MDIITADYESFWATDYSLTKLSPLEYVLGDQFETISCSIKLNSAPTEVYFGEDEVRRALKDLATPIANGMLLGHNNLGFDSYISSYVFGIKPKMWACTAAMARPLHGKTCGVSLAKLVEHYGLGVKNNAVLLQTKGKHLSDFTADELAAMRTYNKEDTDQCYALFRKLKPHYTAAELWQIDALTRMRVEPKFEVDVPMLETALSIERDQKRKHILMVAKKLRTTPGFESSAAVMEAATLDTLEEAVRAELASAPKFSALLEACGVPVPMKPSPSNPDKQVPALAKTDEAFTDLQEHDDPIVSAAARARLAVKSTLVETRIGKFLVAARLSGGLLPVPIRYCGADTTGRDSGEEYNCQNLPRINPSKPKTSDALRNCIRAPKGHKIIVSDLSGIEMRVNHFLWKVESSMELFQNDVEADLYKDFASARYGVPVNQVDKTQRQMGKVAHLGLGFGAGAPTFKRFAKVQYGMEISEDEAVVIVSEWREKYAAIVKGWKLSGMGFLAAYKGQTTTVDPWGMVTSCPEGLRLPSGRLIRYPNLRMEEDGTWPDGRPKKSMMYAHGRHKARITGPKACENCLSADTIVLTDKGCKRIIDVSLLDRLWDGTAWVRHQGVKQMGVKPTLSFGGVFMTPDHKVYANGKWNSAVDTEPREAVETYQGSYRVPDGYAEGYRGIRYGRTAHHMESPVRLRSGESVALRESDQREQELWVRPVQDDLRSQQDPRVDRAPGVPSLELHAAALRDSDTPSVQKLRGAWDNSMRTVEAIVQPILGRHGTNLLPGVGTGPGGQQQRVHARELPVGNLKGEHSEQAEQRGNTDAARSDVAVEGRGSVGDREDHFALQAQAQLARCSDVRYTEFSEPVYDVINSGPKHRFTVLLPTGEPIMVHNCVQALARDVIFDNALDFYKSTSLRPQLRVHDELVYVVPDSEAQPMLDELQRIMRTPPVWWPELVTWSEGDIAQTYGSAK